MALRWALGAVAALFAAGWVALAAAGDAFRRSWGASPSGPLVALLPLGAAALALASVAWPASRPLLHLAAAGAALLVAGCLWLARSAPFVATLGLLYAAAWLVFYWRAAWRG